MSRLNLLRHPRMLAQCNPSARSLAMPIREVALFRGINVGRAKRVAMADLRRLAADLGYGEISTLLNSGNLIYTAPRRGVDNATRLQHAVAERLGVSARVIVLNADEVDAIIASNPLMQAADDPSRFLVSVLADVRDGERARALRATPPEAIAVGERAVYLWCANGILDSVIPVALAKLLGDAHTARNWATLLKIQAQLRV
jgi:uncharacterized protein (DUF1697 family)